MSPERDLRPTREVNFRIGLTGGIGTGKSTVAAMLARRGAAVIDADEIAREVVLPGGPAHDAVVARFGPEIVRQDGTVDRSALASLVFADPHALADLNAITHPVIGAVMLERLTTLDGPGLGSAGTPGPGTPGPGHTDPGHPGPGTPGPGTPGPGHPDPGHPGGIAVAVIPLLRPAHLEILGLGAVVVVDCPIEVAVGRLVAERGMDEADARARMAAQPSREERLALADYVVGNGSTPEHLATEVDALWAWLDELRRRDAAT